MKIDIRNSVLAANAAGIETRYFEAVFKNGYFIDAFWRITHKPNKEITKKFCDKHLVKVLKKYGYKVNVHINSDYCKARVISILGDIPMDDCTDSEYISMWLQNGTIAKIR